MVHETSVWSYIINASFIVKCVMLILLAASVASWAIIIQRYRLLKLFRHESRSFEDQFWSGIDLKQLYQNFKQEGMAYGLANIFQAGFNEFNRLSDQATRKPNVVMEGVARAMRVAQAREAEQLERHLSFLATVGSTSPYIGLFGTVWGIMTAFSALGTVSNATIAMVAPGISEALIATAMGLFAAIPAVIAYNRFTSELEQLNQRYDTFEDEFSSILYHELHSEGAH